MPITLPAALLSVACATQTKPLPEKIQGLWELHQIETPGGHVDAQEIIAQRYPGCTWGRMTWSFDDGHLAVGYDVLCPAAADDFYGCQVSARVPATWDPDLGQWHVAYPVGARSRTVGLDEESIQTPTVCEVTVNQGDYPVVRVRGEDWRWEMRTPDGSVFRLRLPESDRPDFVAAIKADAALEAQ